MKEIELFLFIFIHIIYHVMYVYVIHIKIHMQALNIIHRRKLLIISQCAKFHRWSPQRCTIMYFFSLLFLILSSRVCVLCGFFLCPSSSTRKYKNLNDQLICSGVMILSVLKKNSTSMCNITEITQSMHFNNSWK